MERVRRRWWTWSISILAVLVIFAGSISGLFQLAVMTLPDYRDDLSVWVTKIAGRPVQIGGINLAWHGINPRLDLSSITVYSEDGDEEELTADRLSLGFSLMRLIRRDYSPQHVVLSGLSLGVQVDPAGHITIAGFERPAQDQRLDLRKWLQQINRFESVQLQRCTVELEDQRPGHQTQLRFALNGFEVDLRHGGFDAEAQIKLPSTYGDTLSLETSIEGALPDYEHWSGDFRIRARGLMPQPWLRGRVAAGTRVAAEAVDADLRGRLGAGRLTQLDADLDTGALLATRAGRSVETQSLKAQLQVLGEAEGWRFNLRRFELDGQEPLTAGARYQPLADGGFELNAEASALHLDQLTPWLQFSRELALRMPRVADLGGDVNNLMLRLRHTAETDQYSLRAEVHNLALKSQGDGVGASGISGEFSADESGGRFKMAQLTPTLQLPRVLETAVDFDALSGELQWQRLAEGWRLQAPQLDWKTNGISGRSQFELLLPAEAGRSPELKLESGFAVADITRIKPYMPRHWNEHLKAWLGQSIEAGRVPRAQLTINGPLAEFPFHDGESGKWKLDLEVADGRLAYSPHWPAVENVHAQVHFLGNGLSVEADAADLSGNHAERVVARIEDFHDHRLSIDGSISGEAASFYSFLLNSPLRESLATLVTHTRASGPARVVLHLDIPLQDAAKTSASGTVGLAGVQMFYAGLREPISDIRGEIAFNNAGVSSPQLSAVFEDAKLALRIDPRPQTHGVIIAEFPFAPRTDGTGLSAYIPAFLRPALAGQSAWQAELPLAPGNSELTLSSTLQGVAVNLPKPLSKAADETIPLRIAIGATEATQDLRVRVAYEGRVNADIDLARSEAPATGAVATAEEDRNTLKPRSVSLQLGKTSPAPVQEGMQIGGDTEELDLPAWSAALSSLIQGAQPGDLTLRKADLHADRLLFPGQFVRDARLVYTPAADGWYARVSGAGAEGELAYASPAGGQLRINLARLDLEKLAPDAPEIDKPGARVFDPTQAPVLEFSCAQCTLDGADFGQIKLNTTRLGEGQRLEFFTAENGKLETNASGEWLRAKDQSSARLKFDLASQDFTTLLKSLGYAQTLSAKTSHLSGELQWTPQSTGLAWTQARGRIGMEFENGTLKAVDPGAGRVLGLLNFYALPRRLTLDFRDVVKSGLAFDKIAGNFDLADGNATTEDLRIDATSLRMEMRGRVGLAARDYDQLVMVYPDVSSGITLGAALLGGPALAALAFIAQEVLDKPLEQATHLSYRITGSWDNPEVKRVDSSEAAKSMPAPAAPAAPAAPPAPVTRAKRR